jgi:hypothetical protein
MRIDDKIVGKLNVIRKVFSLTVCPFLFDKNRLTWMFGPIYFRCPVQMLMCHVHLLNDGRFVFNIFCLYTTFNTNNYINIFSPTGWWLAMCEFFPENKNSAWKISMDNAGNETHHPSIWCVLSITATRHCYDRSQISLCISMFVLDLLVIHFCIIF